MSILLILCFLNKPKRYKRIKHLSSDHLQKDMTLTFFNKITIIITNMLNYE